MHAEQLCSQIRLLLEQDRIHEAYLLAIAQNPQEHAPHMRGIDEADMRRALQAKPRALAFLAEPDLREVQIRLALAYGGCGDENYSPTPLWPYKMAIRTAVHVLYMAAEAEYNLRSWRESGLVEEVRVYCSCNGPCDACAAVRDGGPYPLPVAPVPPFPDCMDLHEHGCRCILVASKIKGIKF